MLFAESLGVDIVERLFALAFLFCLYGAIYRWAHAVNPSELVKNQSVSHVRGSTRSETDELPDAPEFARYSPSPRSQYQGPNP